MLAKCLIHNDPRTSLEGGACRRDGASPGDQNAAVPRYGDGTVHPLIVPLVPLLASPAWSGGFSSRHLSAALLGGLALLAVALIILMLTRWGQARPLSKCMALSVFAHVLFFAYAYGTKLMFDRPVLPEEAPLRVRVVELETAEQSRLDPNNAGGHAAQPWDHFASFEFAAPPVAAPDRQATEIAEPRVAMAPADLPLKAVPIAAPLSIGSLPPPELDTQQQPEPELDTQGSPSPAPPAAPSAIAQEAASSKPVEEGPPLSPVDVALPRQEAPRDRAVAAPDSLLPQPQEPTFDVATQLHRLGEQAFSDPLAETVSDRQEGEAVRPPPLEATATAGPADPALLAEPTALDATAPGGLERESYPGTPHSTPANPLRHEDRAVVPRFYALRDRSVRRPALEHYGGTAETEEAVTAALAWLVANQQPDGRWDPSLSGAGRESRVFGHDRGHAGAAADTGITALAVLALLGSGETHLEGTYGSNLQRGLEFLTTTQQSDGSLAGEASLFARMYCHGIAALALSEAYALTGDQRLEPYVQRAIQYTVRAQHPTLGGWRYQPGDRGDMSQFGWQVMALKSAELGGMTIPGATRAGMLRFLHDLSSGPHGGRAGYRRGEQASRTMTAEALVCRLFLGPGADDAAAVREATVFVLEELPSDGMANLYYWYYATLAMFQVQGEPWRIWNQALQKQLLARQRRDGHLSGSWDPDTVWGSYGGRVYSTAMATLSLEVYYRYLPVYGQ